MPTRGRVAAGARDRRASATRAARPDGDSRARSRHGAPTPGLRTHEDVVRTAAWRTCPGRYAVDGHERGLRARDCGGGDDGARRDGIVRAAGRARIENGTSLGATAVRAALTLGSPGPAAA